MSLTMTGGTSRADESRCRCAPSASKAAAAPAGGAPHAIGTRCQATMLFGKQYAETIRLTDVVVFRMMASSVMVQFIQKATSGSCED